jgi:hypothetical protein
MHRKPFLKWMGTSLIGHVFFYELIFAVPIMGTFLYLNYSDGTLTATWAVHIMLVSFVFGAMVAAGIWYVITLPQIKRRGRDQG